MKFISPIKYFFPKPRIRHSYVAQAVAEGIQELFIEMGYVSIKKDEKTQHPITDISGR